MREKADGALCCEPKNAPPANTAKIGQTEHDKKMTGKTTFSVLLEQRIPTPDGTTLCATVLLPTSIAADGTERGPVLLCLTPYGTDFVYPWATRNVRSRYIVVLVDVRGRGESDGDFALFDDAADGEAAIRWILMQPWCSGEVALFGGSYSGINQWAIAACAPAGLHAIAPTVAPMPGFDTGFPDGIPRTYELRWAAYIQGRASRRALFDDDVFWRELFASHVMSGDSFAALGNRLGAPISAFDTQLLHHDNPAWWARRAVPNERLARIQVPVLSITGCSDDAHRGAIEFHRRFLAHTNAASAAQSVLVIGPWNHAGARMPPKLQDEPPTKDALFDTDPLRWSDELTLAWFDMHLKRKPRPASLENRVNVFVLGRERWVHGDCLDSLAPQSWCLHLDGETLMQQSPIDSCERSFVADPGDDRLIRAEVSGESANLWQCLNGAQPMHQFFAEHLTGAQREPCGLRWCSTPLEKSMTLIGTPRIRLTLRLDQPDADLAAALIAHLPCGISLTLSGSTMRLRYRDGRHSPRLWACGTVESIDLPSPGFIARELPAGTRLSLVVRSVISLSFQPNRHTGADSILESNFENRTATIAILAGPNLPPALELPVEATHAS